MAKRTATRKTKSEEAPPPPTWDEKLVDELRPWRMELLGGFLLLLALISIMGLTGLSSSRILNPWANFWWQLAGWGAFVLFLALAGIGIHLITRRMEGRRPIQVTSLQVVGFELIVLTSLPLSHLLTGANLTTSYAGRGGGLLGWALSEPIINLLGPLPTFFIYLLFMLTGLALVMQIGWVDVLKGLRVASAKLSTWARQLEPPEPVVRPELEEEVIVAEAVVEETATAVPAEDTSPAPKPRRRRVKRASLLPPLSMLEKGGMIKISRPELDYKKERIEQTFKDFGIPATVVSEQVGPAITQFGIQPGYHIKEMPDGTIKKFRVRVSKIAGLANDLALALAAPRVRIEAPVPGKGIVGVEVPNSETSMVRLGDIIDSEAFRKIKGSTGFALGLDVSGTAVAGDVTKLPHMLVAGQTGSGKSVFMNALISCLLFNNTPHDLQFVMIDPKKVELIRFNGFPHLIGKVETEADRVIGVLRWLTQEMDERYRKLSEIGARNITAYNRAIKKYKDVNKMPYIVACIDELADLMVQYPADVERHLCRLAQMARAVGIHLIVATQRPSTDVITGLIKANFPARISFAVASLTDSRVILDSKGAENLLGRGDMLFLSADASAPKRIQGCFVGDEEIDRIAQHWKEKLPGFKKISAPWESLIEKQTFLEEQDELLERAIALTQKYDSVSASLLQRRLRIGFPRAAALIQTLHEMGLVEDGKSGGQTRKVYVDKEAEDPLAEFLNGNGGESETSAGEAQSNPADPPWDLS